jgi:hypothetical protein
VTVSAANSMRINFAKMRVVSYSRQTNVLSYEHQLCHVAITRTSTIKDQRIFFDLMQHFYSHVDFLFPESIKLLGFIPSIIIRIQIFFPGLFICVVLYVDQVHVGI